MVHSAIAHSVSFEKSSDDSSSQMFDFFSYGTSDNRDLLVMERYVSEKFFVDNLAEQNLNTNISIVVLKIDSHKLTCK